MVILNNKIWVAIYFCIFITCIKSKTTPSKKQQLPKLNLMQDWPEADWKFLNLSDGTVALFSQIKSTFILNCSAPYPVHWKIRGRIEPPEYVRIQPYHRITQRTDNSLESELFKSQIIIFFNSIDNTFSSATISCEKIGDPALASGYAVFVPSDKNILLTETNILQPFDSKFIIPCPTTDPNFKVTLHRANDGTGEILPVPDEFLSYSPTEGFKSSNSFGSGTFVCIGKHIEGNETRVNFTIPNCVQEKENINLLTYNKADPSCVRTWEVKAFVGEDLEIFCSTPNYAVISKNNSENLDASIVWKQLPPQNSPFPKYKIPVSTNTSTKGVVKCGAFGDENITEIWNYEVLGPAPEIYLDNHEGEVDCLSEYPDRSVSTVRCRDPSACEYMKHCFNNGKDHKSCNFLRLKHFHSQYPGRCWVQERNEGAYCATMPYYHLNGLVQCGGGGGAVKYFTFFVGLDFRRYSDWRAAPQNALIRLGYEKFENRTEFYCEAAAFLFADSLKFSVKYQNGTEKFLDSSSPGVNVTNPSLHDHPKRMDEFNVVGVLVKTDPFPTEVVALLCHAPWWNSTEWKTTEMELNPEKRNFL